MNKISQSIWSAFPYSHNIDVGDKETISMMSVLDQWKYIDEQLKLGNVIEYDPQIKSPLVGSDIIIYYDKNTDVYSLCHPWTGSFWVDISKEEFERLMATKQYYDNM